MRARQAPLVWWRFLVVPLVVWLVLTVSGMAGLLWAQHRSRDGVVERFELRLELMGDFVTGYVADQLDRQRVQANAFLAGPVVPEEDFARSVAAFGYPTAVLLDSRGRLLRAVPADPAAAGRDLSSRYPHLRAAVGGQPAVSPAVPSTALSLPVVAFAVPFDTASGRRVFAGAVPVTRSSLSSYLSTAWTLTGIRVQLVDTSGAIVASNRPTHAAAPTVTGHDPALAAALQQGDRGRYHDDGRWWRYSSVPIHGAPWRLSATVTEDVLFASSANNELAGRVAVVAAAGAGLLVVAAAGRARRNRRALQLSEQRFRKVFDHSRIGMIISDPAERLLRVNPAFGQMLGQRPDRLVGQHVTDVSHPDDADTGQTVLRDCLAGRIDSFELDKRYQHTDGHTVEAAVTSVLIRDPANRPQFFATQIIDMTERRALERARDRQQAELAEHADQLQHANTQMNDFIAMLSHDVRQPLASIVARSDLLLDEWNELDDTGRHRYLRQITAAGHRADHLLTEILTLAQLDAGAIIARPSHLDISHTAHDTAAAHGPATNEPIIVTAPEKCIALADPAHLQLILANLIGNATKYGAPPITITVTNHTQHVTLDVADHGEGVPHEFVQHLFERFARADTGVAVTKPGTGLGLYLVQKLAEAGGITVTHRRNRPHGSIFTLTLPCPPQPNTTTHERRHHNHPAATPEK